MSSFREGDEVSQVAPSRSSLQRHYHWMYGLSTNVDSSRNWKRSLNKEKSVQVQKERVETDPETVIVLSSFSHELTKLSFMTIYVSCTLKHLYTNNFYNPKISSCTLQCKRDINWEKWIVISIQFFIFRSDWCCHVCLWPSLDSFLFFLQFHSSVFYFTNI